MSTASDQNRKKALQFFHAGNDAVQKDSLDYAIQMYRDACKLDPGNLIIRQSLRGAQRKKFNNDPAKVGRLVGARTQPLRMRARSATGKGRGADALDLCEEAFSHNPWDLGTARDAAEAAESMDLKPVAQWLMESVAASATDAEFFRHLARVYEANGAWQKAISAWERVKKLVPNDENANRKINQLAASATIQRGGFEEALNRPEPTANDADRLRELEELKKPQLTPEQRWMQEIQEHPTHVGPYLQFAEHLKGRGKLDDAQKLLARGLKAVPDDPSMQLLYFEVQLGRIERKIASLTERVKARPDDETAAAELQQLQTKLLEYDVMEFQRRVKLNPEDAKLYLELGTRQARAGKHKDAIASFQQARSGPNDVRIEALYQAGLSFEAENVLKLAERSYQDAVKVADPKNLDVMNKLNYRLGRVCEAMGDVQVALDFYNEVAANDYAYLDVAERIRNLS